MHTGAGAGAGGGRRAQGPGRAPAGRPAREERNITLPVSLALPFEGTAVKLIKRVTFYSCARLQTAPQLLRVLRRQVGAAHRAACDRGREAAAVEGMAARGGKVRRGLVQHLQAHRALQSGAVGVDKRRNERRERRGGRVVVVDARTMREEQAADVRVAADRRQAQRRQTEHGRDHRVRRLVEVGFVGGLERPAGLKRRVGSEHEQRLHAREATARDCQLQGCKQTALAVHLAFTQLRHPGVQVNCPWHERCGDVPVAPVRGKRQQGRAEAAVTAPEVSARAGV
eukprot:scaffold71236_cov69-Phaeocystis_antarctica.AAC.6